MDEEDLKDWDSLPDDAPIQFRKADLDSLYISILQVSLALLSGDAELRSRAQGNEEMADENRRRKVQALNDSRDALRELFRRIAARMNEQGSEA